MRNYSNCTVPIFFRHKQLSNSLFHGRPDRRYRLVWSGPVRSPIFLSEILFGPVHDRGFGPDFYLVPYAVRILVRIFIQISDHVPDQIKSRTKNPYHVPDQFRVRIKFRTTYWTEKNPDHGPKSGPGPKIFGTDRPSMVCFLLRKVELSLSQNTV